MASPDGWSGLFSSAFSHSRNAMVLLDADRRQRDVNGAYLRMLGYRRDQLIGRPIWEFVKDGPAATEEEWRAYLGEHRFDGDVTMLAADGSTVNIDEGAFTEHGVLVDSGAHTGMDFARAFEALATHFEAQGS